MQEKELPSREKMRECLFSPHSMRATTATLLLRCGHRICSGSPRPQAHHHDPDLRQAATVGAGFRLAQSAYLIPRRDSIKRWRKSSRITMYVLNESFWFNGVISNFQTVRAL
jgi:hypothetical protein